MRTGHREALAFVAGQIHRQSIADWPDAESVPIPEVARLLVPLRQRVAEVRSRGIETTEWTRIPLYLRQFSLFNRELERHSEAKLNVLRDYVTDYICILCADSYGRDAFRITMVDGFAGGGAYGGGKFGSPFVFLEAVAAAESKINANRQKPLSIECHYYFVEENREAFECLQAQLQYSVYKDRIGKTIFLKRGSFHECQAQIIAETKARFTRGGSRVIFFLDQCGYTDVHPRLLNSISAELNNKAEFIINFAVSWLIDFVSDTGEFRQMLASLGLDSELSAENLIRAKEKSGSDWRYVIEAMIGPAFRKVAGARFFSPFYIAPIDIVAVAPTYPECGEVDLRATLTAVAELEPLTIFHEPINIRAENVARIEEQAKSLGVRLKTEVFATRESWQDYAVNALHTAFELAREPSIEKHLHLWPDKSLGSQSLADRMPSPGKYLKRLEHWWHRISEWPK